MRNRWSRIRVLAALGLCAALNMAARPHVPAQSGDVVISGVVFHDANGNQRQDARERGLPNVSVISQTPDAQGGAVNASALTAADGSFSIQTHVGDRISVVPGAGYKTMQPAGVIVREGLQTLAFALYVDKVVVDRVIRMEPAAVTVPAPQVYVSPQITLPAPVVNVQPADVRIAPAEIIIQPAPVQVAPTIAPGMLWAAIVVIGLSMLAGAGIVAAAIRAHARTLRDVALFEASCSACHIRVDAINWKGVAEQVVADTTARVITVEELVSMSIQPVPTLRFRATNGQVFVFSLGGNWDELSRNVLQIKCVSGQQFLATALELQALWHFFAASMHLPSHLPRAQCWLIVVVSGSVVGDDLRSNFANVDLLADHQPSPSHRDMATECSQCERQKDIHRKQASQIGCSTHS
jgi:hypothetical protein